MRESIRLFVINAAYIRRPAGRDIDDHSKTSLHVFVRDDVLVDCNIFQRNDLWFLLHDSDLSRHRLCVFDAELFSKHLYYDRSVVGSNAVAVANGVPESPPTEFPPQGCKLSEELRSSLPWSRKSS